MWPCVDLIQLADAGRLPKTAKAKAGESRPESIAVVPHRSPLMPTHSGLFVLAWFLAGFAPDA
jgi:hypothetical protein